MAVSKRLRHEVMRRDNFACRYCGATAPDVKLTIDHVTPTTLGGSDEPANLVTACADCNSGKSATPPDAPLVADVEQDALRWAKAKERVAKLAAAEQRDTDKLNATFYDVWQAAMPQWAQLDASFPESLASFRSRGLPEEVIHAAVWKASNANHIPQRSLYRYFCGICWGKITDLEAAASALLLAEETDDGA